VRNLLGGIQPRVDDGHCNHQNAMLYALRQHGDFGEETLVCRARHDLVRIPLAPAVWPNDHNRRTQEFDEMPPSASDGEEIVVI
jgi:hypothetical protein